MNSDRLNRWLTLLANAAVFVGIVFLAVELQQNNEQLVEQSRQSVADGVRQIALSVATTPSLARLISGEVAIEDMTGTERMQIAAWVAAWLKSAEHAFLQYQSGVLSEEIWLTRKTQAIGMLDNGNIRTLYERNRDMYLPGFVAEVDEALDRLE